VSLTPAIKLDLEQALEFIDDDELPNWRLFQTLP
jgi:predicted membrane GTPase involved in stress response